MRAHDWSATALGPPAAWPQSLRTTLGLMLGARQPRLILWGPELIQLYNDPFAELLGPARHPAALGAPGRDCWAEVWDAIGPPIEAVLAGQDARWPDGGAARAVPEPWRHCAFSPIEDAARPHGVGGLLVAAAAPGGAAGTAAAGAAAGAADPRAVLEQMDAGYALCALVPGADGTAEDFRFLLLNAAFGRHAGLRGAAAGRRASEVLPGPAQAWLATFARVAETGEPARLEHRLAGFGRWLDVLAFRDAPGRFVVLLRDVTERKAAEARQELLAREVDHRARNALAVVQAAIRLTRAPDLAGYRAAIEGRVAALARAHALLAERRWTGADLAGLLSEAIAGSTGPTPCARARVSLRGPEVTLAAAAVQPLAMAIHELCANALQHGALSVPEGRVAVAWEVAGGRLRLGWRESGGPPVLAPPRHRGFGARMLAGSIGAQLGGTLVLRWPPAGLACEIELPLAARSRPFGRLPAPP